MEPCKVCEEPTDFFCALCGGFYFCKKHACRHSSPEQFASKAADSAAASVSGTQQLTFGGVKWETAYGWLFAVAGAYLLVAGLATFFAGEKAASIGLSVGNAKPIGIAAAAGRASPGFIPAFRNNLTARMSPLAAALIKVLESY